MNDTWILQVACEYFPLLIYFATLKKKKDMLQFDTGYPCSMSSPNGAMRFMMTHQPCMNQNEKDKVGVRSEQEQRERDKEKYDEVWYS